MFTTIKRHAWVTPTLRFVPVIAIAAAAMIAMAPDNARAQGLNVKDYSCNATQLAINVDVRGLGTQNVCVVGDVSLNLFCACANKGGNCANDAKKQIEPTESETDQVLEPKNGRVVSTLTLPLPTKNDDALCAPSLDCPGGQRVALVGFVTTSAADFTLCTTALPAGSECTCPSPPDQTVLASEACAEADVRTIFNDVSQDCVNLFP
jgi:hypothetical protein